MKIKAVLLTVLLTVSSIGCVNLASPVNNITIIKIQMGGGHDMHGSKLDDVARDFSQDAGDVKIPVK